MMYVVGTCVLTVIPSAGAPPRSGKLTSLVLQRCILCPGLAGSLNLHSPPLL